MFKSRLSCQSHRLSLQVMRCALEWSSPAQPGEGDRVVSEELTDPRVCRKNTSDLTVGISYSTVNETVFICNYLSA